MTRVSLGTSCLAVLTIVHAAPSSVREYFDVGVAKDSAGEYDGAIDAFKKQCLSALALALSLLFFPHNSLTGRAIASIISPPPQSRSRQRHA